MDQASQIREKIDLVALISEYLPLKKSGRNFNTNCPFHNEKTPSFVISPERQIWHCFGCGKGGDCFTFLMEYEKLEFPEALRILAKKTGVELAFSQFETGVSSKKERIFSLNSLAAEFYHYVLTKHNVGRKALSYFLEKRKIRPQVINAFKLGFSPYGDALAKYLLNKKKYKKEDLIEAGLAIYKKGRIADFFVNRIIFPLFDHRGNIVGFSGRIINGFLDSGPKYVNTKETIVYHKSDVFFGLNIAKEAIKKEGTAIIAEGEFDVISCFQEGIRNIIAIKGTALTENQVNLISRYTQKVSLCLDQDNAGIEATKRSLLPLEKKGLITTVILTPNGKDPDEAVKINPLDFKKSIKNDIGIYDYLLEIALKNFDSKTMEGKKKISDEILPLISLIENEIIKEHYLKKLGEKIDASYESITRQLEKLEKKEIKNPASPTIVNTKKDREEILEEYLLSLIIQSQNPKFYLEKILEVVVDISFKTTSIQKIIGHLAIYFRNQEIWNEEKFLRGLPIEFVPAFDLCSLFPLPKFFEEKKYEEEIIKITKELRKINLRNKIKVVSEKIKLKEKTLKNNNNQNEQNEEMENLRKELTDFLSLLKTY